MTTSTGGRKYHKNRNKKKGNLDCSQLAYGLPSKTRYRRKDRGKDRSDGKTKKKKTYASIA